MALAEDRASRRAGHDPAHMLADLIQPVLHEGEDDRVPRGRGMGLGNAGLGRRVDLDPLRVPEHEAVFATKSKVKSAGCAGCASADSCGSAKTDEACDDGDTPN